MTSVKVESLQSSPVGTRFLADVERVFEEVQAVDPSAWLRANEPPAGLHPAVVALALFRHPDITLDALIAGAKQRISSRRPQMHTFVPLYTTNHCDSECKMCAMRKGNDRLIRKFAGKRTIEQQLQVLFDHERVRGVGLLTGEYHDEYTRLANAFRIGWTARRALDMGFERVYVNIGSMSDGEIEVLGEWLDADAAVTMCVFQETYNRRVYDRFMGRASVYPKGDYERRISSFDRWLDAGLRYVNPGVLVGLHKDVEEEFVALLVHVHHLAQRGAVVDISLPRLRPAQGTRNASGVDDDVYLRVLAAIAFACPEQRIVLTNREEEAFWMRAVELCGVFSPGSPDVAPYRADAPAINELNTSQFLVGDLRRPRDLLRQVQRGGHDVDLFAEAPDAGTA